MAESSSSRLVLALDTSTDQLACAVARLASEADGVHGIEVLAARDHLCRRHANEELADCARAALAEAGLCMEDVDQVLVGRGPGSFTGVRIAVATAKGLACGLGKPLHGGSTLDAVAWTAWQAGVRGRLAVANDAMRGEVYPGIYLLDAAGAHRTFPGETVTKADACVEAWTHLAERDELQLTGNGLFKYRARFEAAGFGSFVDESLWLPTAEGLVRSVCAPDFRPAQGDGDPALVLPVYTRLSDAEENERKRLGLKQPASVEVTGVDDALADAHLQLRPMSVNDLDQVAAMEASVFAGAAHTAWTRNMFYEATTVPGSTWWVAHDRGRIVGFDYQLKSGEIVEVSDGYAKNYILPKKLGREATNQVMNNWKQQKASEANRKEMEKQQAIATVKDLETKVITMKEKAGQDGRLFGSVTAKDLAEALKQQYGVDVDRKKINLKDPIRAVGNYSVEIKLQAEAVGRLTVQILPQE